MNAATQPATAPPPKRMSVASVKSGRVEAPLRLMVHGVDGVGKSTFGASAPQPVFLGTEDGTGQLDVSRFATPDAWSDLLEAVASLTSDAHDFRTLVVDSLDWAEPLLWASICRAEKVPSIEDVGGGWGKGYTKAVDDWRVLLAALERLQRQRGMHVILIAHSLIKTFRNPQGEDFDRYILKMNEKAAGLLREWCGGVYFANYETFAVKDKAKRVRGVSTGARLLYTQRTAAYDAKDRYGLPEQLPLSWEEFERGKSVGAVSAEVLRAEIERKATQLNDEVRLLVASTVAKAGDSIQQLSLINNRVNAKLAEKAEKGN